MELQINDLISSIKKDGVDAANKAADEIIAAAKKEAANIISAAKKEAEQIKADNENEINILKENAKLNAEHAKRDAMLAFKASVKAEFEKILAKKSAKVLDGKVLAELIKAALNDENPADYSAEVAEVSEELKGELAREIENGLEIWISKNVRTGFKLSQNDGSGYFDCSDDEIVSMLAPFFHELNI